LNAFEEKLDNYMYPPILLHYIKLLCAQSTNCKAKSEVVVLEANIFLLKFPIQFHRFAKAVPSVQSI